MTTVIYACPICDESLVDLSTDPTLPADAAPFTCYPCARSFWQVELDNIDAFDPTTRSFDPVVQADIIQTGAQVETNLQAWSTTPEEE